MKYTEPFIALLKDLLTEPVIQNMRTLKQHANSATLLEHLLYTSYISYRLCRFFKLNPERAVRAALLHDFRLDDTPENKQLLSHSRYALEAANKHFKLTPHEQNIIVSHMWPLTPFHLPRSKEAWIVNIADTYCAMIEGSLLFNKTKTTRKLAELAALSTQQPALFK